MELLRSVIYLWSLLYVSITIRPHRSGVKGSRPTISVGGFG
jgi:hypothetical protein